MAAQEWLQNLMLTPTSSSSYGVWKEAPQGFVRVVLLRGNGVCISFLNYCNSGSPDLVRQLLSHINRISVYFCPPPHLHWLQISIQNFHQSLSGAGKYINLCIKCTEHTEYQTLRSSLSGVSQMLTSKRDKMKPQHWGSVPNTTTTTWNQEISQPLPL